MEKTALVVGITGQDGGYLAEFLLEKGYKVYGIHRRSSVDGHMDNVKHLKGRLNLICADLLDFNSIERALKVCNPDEIYNLAAQSHVGQSFNQPHLTNEINWLGVERLIDCIKEICPNAKLYQASTSELFGQVTETPQNERTKFNPVSPYSKAKLKAHNAIKRARDEGMFACAGILFNHESPRRGLEFVTRKFTEGIARVKLGLPQRESGKRHLELGNLYAKRDWGYALDYVEAMWLMLQQETPKDYVISTGENHTIKEFIDAASEAVGIEVVWKGEGLGEVGYDQFGNKIITVNPEFFRPNEVHDLRGDSEKARLDLGWHPRITFKELVKMMVKADMERLREENAQKFT